MTRSAWILLGAGIAAIVVAIGGWTLWHRGKPAADAATDNAAPSVKLTLARRGTFDETVDAQGRVGAPAGSSAKVAFAQSGIVQAIFVRVGQRVTAGQPLAKLDRSALKAALDQAQGDARAASASFAGGHVPSATAASAQSRLLVATARLDTLERGGPSALSSRIGADSSARQAAIKVIADRAAIERDRELFGAGVLARKDLDAAIAQLASDEADARAADAKAAVAVSDFDSALKQARADVASAQTDLAVAQAQQGVLGGQAASAQARLEAARIAYANGVLAAPADGIVLAILKHPGEVVDSTQPAFEIGPALGNVVTLTVPGAQALRVRVGDPVDMHGQASQAVSSRGTVVAVLPAVDPATQAATIVVRGAPGDAVAGEALTATIVVAHSTGILVPTTAIVQDPQTGKNVVFVHDSRPKPGESAFALREVTVRASNSSIASIASGIQAGETVAAQGGYALLSPIGG